MKKTLFLLVLVLVGCASAPVRQPPGPGTAPKATLGRPNFQELMAKTEAGRFYYSDNVRVGTPYPALVAAFGNPRREYSVEGTVFVEYGAFAFALTLGDYTDRSTWRVSGFIYHYQPELPVEEWRKMVPEPLPLVETEIPSTALAVYQKNGHRYEFWINSPKKTVLLVKTR